ncbi:unnamed protein product [Coregonus sp. 'balchen']|uniref:Tankyrase 1-binding protein C-terminal domain-containing protein n=1 Tax=Coregonus suidteri TaxID=861788 RepID=A0AAN8M0R2_9TELE|nr:unnamed protein product [Coregonus sp. 'balchen']
MQYLGGKLSSAQVHVSGWVGSVRRSLQGALDLVWGDEEEVVVVKEEEEDEGEGGGGGRRFERAVSPLRSFASRSRKSLRLFSVRSRQRMTLRRRAADTSAEQLKCCVGLGEGHDTEALIGGEPDKQYGGCDTRLSEDNSPQTTVEQISPVTPDEPNSTYPLEETEEPLAFPDISPPLLDTSAQRARAELRKSRRTRPPRAVRQNPTTATLEEDRDHDWRFCDSSDKVDSLTRGDCESDEEQPRGREVCSPPSQPQRIPLFSGMDPSALKAQLKKRRGGGGKGEDKEGPTDTLAPSPSQLFRSPGCSSFLPGASQVLPLVGNKDGGGDSSPSWLQELKSKKRLSQYNSED